MSVTLPLKRMSRQDKLRAMERLWQDLCQDEADYPSPAWHGDLLRERLTRAKAGGERFVDWETAKRSLRGTHR